MALLKKMICYLFGRPQHCSEFSLENVLSILIRPMGHLVGDTVVHIAYIRQLKTMYPHCRIGILVTKRSRPIYECCTLIDNLIDDTFSSCLYQRKKWQFYLDFYETYNSRHIIKTALLSPAAIMIFHKTPKSYYNTDTLLNYTFHCPPPREAHMVSLLQTSAFSDYFSIPKPNVSLNRVPLMQKVRSYWQDGKLRILLAPQGSVVTRRIPPQEMAELLNSLSLEIANKCQFLLGNAHNSINYLAELKELCPGLDISSTPPTDLKQYLSLIAEANLVIAVDSGSVHLACAFQRPLLCFFANNPSNIRKWYPINNSDTPMLVVIANLPAPSSETHSFPLKQATIWLNQQITTIWEQQNI
jgi:alpha 1,6-DD-heptosyltransferase